jgi:peptidoglycan/LPS O-acetylase OafA/YrhL
MREKSEKINSIIILRGIAALMVCTVHFFLAANLKTSNLVHSIFNLGAQGVAIFFVISGFILPFSLYKNNYRISDFFSFLLRRSIRIDPPYWCSIILIFLTGSVSVSLLSLNSIVQHIFYLVPFINGAVWYSNVFWTLAIEFQFYILLGVFYQALDRINPKFAILSLVLISVIFVIIKFDHYGIIFTNFYDFVYGYIMFFWLIKKISKSEAIIILIIFSIFTLLKVSIISAIVPLLTSLFIMVFHNLNKTPGVFTFFGKISYSLYLIHLPLSSIFVYLISQVLVINNTVLFLMCFAICIPLAYLFYLFIEKPSLNLSKKVSLNSSIKRDNI